MTSWHDAVVTYLSLPWWGHVLFLWLLSDVVVGVVYLVHEKSVAGGLQVSPRCRFCVWVQRYLTKVGLGVDQLGNALLDGNEDESITSRTAKHRPAAWAEFLCAFYNFLMLGPDFLAGKPLFDHCNQWVEYDER